MVPPTAPERDTVPTPARSVKEVAPLTVPDKVIFAPVTVATSVVSKIGVLARAIGPVIAMTPPCVVTFPSMVMTVDPV